MSQQYNAMSEVCATCSYWGGSRELKQCGDFLEIGSPMDTGAFRTARYRSIRIIHA